MARFDEFNRYLLPEAGRFPGQTVLEVGMGNGARAEWFLEHILPLADARYVGVMANARQKRITSLRQRFGKYGNKVTLHAGLLTLPCDFTPHMIYLGAVDAGDLGRWTEVVWPSLACSGIFIWAGYHDPKQRVVQDAVDAFLADHPHKVIWAKSNMAVRKL